MSRLDYLYDGVPSEQGETVNTLYHKDINERLQRYRINVVETDEAALCYTKETSQYVTDCPVLRVNVNNALNFGDCFTDEELIAITLDALKRRNKQSKALDRAITALSNAGHALYLEHKEDRLIEECENAKYRYTKPLV